MKLTIQIDTAGDKLDRSIMHARRILGLLDELIERTGTDTEELGDRWAVAGEVDPLPPIPDIDPFAVERVAAQIGKTETLAAWAERIAATPPLKNPSGPITGIDAADPLKVATEDPAEPEDPTRRVVEIPADMHPLPDLPEGYSRWVGRGDEWDSQIEVGNRVVHWWNNDTNKWIMAYYFSNRGLFHIEAVKDEPVVTEAERVGRLAQKAAADLRAALECPEPAPVEQPAEKPRLIPEPGNHYFLRNGKTARIDGATENHFEGAVHVLGSWGAFYWRKDGTPCGSVGPEWDCVELSPF